jgi:hypothetical protein
MATVIRRRQRALGASLLILLLLLLAGCDMFRPALPEIGGKGPSVIANYSSPDSCLHYMKLGIEAKAKGQELYIGALADTTVDKVAGFRAWFDPAVERLFTFRPDQWVLANEREFFNFFLMVRGYPYLMEWQPDTLNSDDRADLGGGTYAVLHRHYHVFSVEPTQQGQDSLLIAVGYADLYFVKISPSRWTLRRWDDRVDPAVGAQPADDLQRSFGHYRLKASAG